MSRAEDDLLKEAIAGTEAEIFNEATGKEPASTEGGPGDRTVEEMGTGLEGQLEADDTDEGETAELAANPKTGEGDEPTPADGEVEADTEAGEADKGQERDPKTGEFVAKPAGDGEQPVDPKAKVPLAELIKERKSRQALQVQLDEATAARTADKQQSQSEFERLNQRIDQLLPGQQPRTAAAPVNQNAPAKIDIFEDPDGFVANLKNEISQDFTKRYVAADLDRTRSAGPEEFDKAFVAITTAAKSDPAVAAAIRAAYASSTPGKDILSWHRRQETLRLVGDNPTDFVERTRKETREALLKDPEFRKQIAAEMRGEKPSAVQDNGVAPPKPHIRLPPSLNGRGGGAPTNSGAASTDNSDRGVFESAFAGD